MDYAHARQQILSKRQFKDQGPVVVCRDFDVVLPAQGSFFGGNNRNLPQGNVVAEPLPLDTRPVTAFVAAVMGTPSGQPAARKYDQPVKVAPQIEFLSRRETLSFRTAEQVEFSAQRPAEWPPEPQYNSQTSQFYEAVHECFANHYPLALSPEVLMYLVMHEVAETVKRNPDTYRHLFTTSAEKETINILNNSLRMGDPTSPWADVLGQFEIDMAKVVPGDILQTALPDFSTHTQESRVSSMVAFMDAASPFYEYRVTTCCGIPKIRLLGESADYRKLADACEVFATLFPTDLGDYFTYLLPVVDKIATQAAGEEYDNDFWKSIYKHHGGSGTDDMSGWITAFLNYMSDGAGSLKPKPADLYDWKKPVGWGFYSRAMIPSHLSQVPFTWAYFDVEYPMQFIGGILAVEPQDGYAKPCMGYGIVHRKEKTV